MIQPWTTLSSKYLLRRKWMNLRMDHVRLPDGVELPEFHVLEYPDWAAVICTTADDKYVLVEQYRYGVGRPSLEFASGAIDAGEAPEAGARRELLEETGYAADKLTFLGAFAPDPSKHTNLAYLYVASGATQIAEPTPDPGEDLRVVLLTRQELDNAIESNRFIHGIHLAAMWQAAGLGLLV
ncbi:MAG: ADP-ribose pyrophosphatase [Rhodothermales bacterium]|jgi:ADP-ribose pyrophosphatase